jgi:hypothetical protein
MGPGVGLNDIEYTKFFAPTKNRSRPSSPEERMQTDATRHCLSLVGGGNLQRALVSLGTRDLLSQSDSISASWLLAEATQCETRAGPVTAIQIA